MTPADRYIVLTVNKGYTVKDLFIALDFTHQLRYVTTCYSPLVRLNIQVIFKQRLLKGASRCQLHLKLNGASFGRQQYCGHARVCQRNLLPAVASLTLTPFVLGKFCSSILILI